MGPRTRLALIAAIGALTLGVVALALVGPRDQRSEPATTTTSTTTTPESTSTTAPPTTGTSLPTTTTTTSPTTTTSTPPSSATTAPPPTEPSGPATVVRRGPTDRRVVALTFDAGSDVGYAAAILDTLRANGIPASFGLTGTWAAAHPELVRRMATEGHQLVNHSYSHPSFTGYSTGTSALSRADRVDQLVRAEAAITAASGTSARPWFRPPFGDEDASVRADVGAAGYRYEVLWTIDSLGWKGLAAAEVAQRCLSRAQPGAIYLLHVGATSSDHAALQQVIDGLREQGYGFATLSGLLAG